MHLYFFTALELTIPIINERISTAQEDNKTYSKHKHSKGNSYALK